MIFNMRICKTLFAAALCLMSFAASAACRPHQIDVVGNYVQPWVEYTATANLNPGKSTANGPVQLGQTISQLQTDIDFTQTTSPATGCVTLEGAVSLSFIEHTVLISEDLKALPCLHYQVSTHENKHVALNRQMHREIQEFARQRIRTRISLLSGSSAESAGELSRWLQNDLQREVSAAWEIKNKQQLLLDTPEEYRAVTDACPDDSAYMKRRLQGIRWGRA